MEEVSNSYINRKTYQKGEKKHCLKSIPHQPSIIELGYTSQNKFLRLGCMKASSNTLWRLMSVVSYHKAIEKYKNILQTFLSCYTN